MVNNSFQSRLNRSGVICLNRLFPNSDSPFELLASRHLDLNTFIVIMYNYLLHVNNKFNMYNLCF